MNCGNSVVSYKRGNIRLLDKVFKSKPIKRGVKSHFDSSKHLLKLLETNVFMNCKQ